MKVTIPQFGILIACLGLVSICQSMPTSGTGTMTDAMNDMVNKLETEIPKSMKAPQEAVKKVSEFMKTLTQNIDIIHNEVKRLETITATNELKAYKLSDAYYGEFYPIRTNLRKTRTELRKLADETVNMCTKVKAFFDHSDKIGAVKTLELELKTLHRFLTKSIPILRNAETQYQDAMAKLEKFEPKIQSFERQLNRMLDKSSADYEKWTSDVRAGVYSGASAGTVGCIIADALGALGICSAIYNAIAWPAAIGGVEAAIAEYSTQLETTKQVGGRVLGIMSTMSDKVGDTLHFLEEELNLINAWQSDVHSLKESIDDIPLELVVSLSDVFIIGLDDLKASAQAFLDRPNIFEADDDDLQAQDV